MKTVILKNKRLAGSLLWRCLKWHVRYFLAKAPSPLACGIYITSRCNFKCGFCNICRKPDVADLPYSKAKKIVDDLSDMDCFYFSVTGGEPLLVDYLSDLLAYVRKSRIRYIHLVTNGYLLDADKAARLGAARVDEISISIDGTEKTHDANRGMPGAYKRALNAVENLKRNAPDVKIVLNTIFFPEDPDECFHVVDLARRLDVYMKVQPLNQHPLFNRDNHVFVSVKDISDTKIKEAVARLRREPRIVNSGIFLDNIYNFFFRKEDLILNGTPCVFGYHHIEVLEDGTAFPCLEAFDWREGMSCGTGLKDLIRSPEYKHAIERLKGCRGCEKSYYICYYEPRITFPINNFLASAVKR